MDELDIILAKYQSDIDFIINTEVAKLDFENNAVRTGLGIVHDAYDFFDHYGFVSA